MTPTTTALMTAEEFYDWANSPERGGTLYELENGKVIEMPSPSRTHGILCWIVSRILTAYLDRRQQGGYLLTNDTGIVLRRNPDTVRGPDVMMFLTTGSSSLDDTQYVEDVPTLAVEVRSPSDRDSRLLKRVTQYLQRGVGMVWVVDPEDHVVTTYCLKEFPKVHDESDTLSGNGILPDFSCVVSEFFRMPGEPTRPATGL